MTDITKLSSHYRIRPLTGSDTDMIVRLCRQNDLFYKYTDARPTAEQIRSDMTITPPGTDISVKYYIGFFDGPDLVAVMDLIDGYPVPDAAYIGFFMMNRAYQGRQIGSSIIGEAAAYLKAAGKTSIRLAIDKGNPQSSRFWRKNGFRVISEADVNGRTKLVAERSLTDKGKNTMDDINSSDQRNARIAEYEKVLDEANRLIKDDPFCGRLATLAAALDAYYTGPLWKRDLADDEAGLLPSDLKRGVLSEDGIYDLLSRYDEIKNAGREDDPGAAG